MQNASKPLPVPVCSIVGSVLGGYVAYHKPLESLFYEAGATGEVPTGNCIIKCQTWFKHLHEEVTDPAAVLGKVIEEFMEVDNTYRTEEQEAGRKKIRDYWPVTVFPTIRAASFWALRPRPLQNR